MRTFWLSIAAAACLQCTSSAEAASSASMAVTLRADVPIICELRHQGAIAPEEHGFSLGQIREYCNSPTGYLVRIDYQQGTMRGTILRIGNRTILLDGSGHDEVARASGPRIRVVDVSATPNARGFTSDSLVFRITPL